MDYCLYIDEAGCTGKLPQGSNKIQPVFALLGLIFPLDSLRDITTKLLDIKKRYQVHNPEHNLGRLLIELKGSTIRRNISNGSRNSKRSSIGILDRVFEAIEEYPSCLISRVYIKGVGENFDGRAVYTSSIQDFYRHFQKFLIQKNSKGIVVLDSRMHGQNSQVSFSVFTEKYKSKGDPYSNVVAPPFFSHSENSAGLQLADLLVSAVVMPMSIETFCKGIIESIHVRNNYDVIKNRYSERIKNLQFRYQDRQGRFHGGISVSDALKKSRNASYLFKKSPPHGTHSRKNTVL